MTDTQGGSDAGSHSDQLLSGEFGREVTGVRVSLTDRCNFDCVYCHNEGLGDTRGPMEPQDNGMSTNEVVRFLEVAREFGVDSVKFTGGEPVLREDLEEIIREDGEWVVNETYLDDVPNEDSSPDPIVISESY